MASGPKPMPCYPYFSVYWCCTIDSCYSSASYILPFFFALLLKTLEQSWKSFSVEPFISECCSWYQHWMVSCQMHKNIKTARVLRKHLEQISPAILSWHDFGRRHIRKNVNTILVRLLNDIRIGLNQPSLCFNWCSFLMTAWIANYWEWKFNLSLQLEDRDFPVMRLWLHMWLSTE